MTERCRMWKDGKQCKAIATVRVRECLSNDSAAPKYWTTWTCAKHSDIYVHVERYEITGVN